MNTGVVGQHRDPAARHAQRDRWTPGSRHRDQLAGRRCRLRPRHRPEPGDPLVPDHRSGPRRHAHRGHRVGGAARARAMGYSRSKIVDADDHTRVIAFTEGQGAKIGEVPEGLEKMPEDKLEIVDSPDLPPLWQVFGAVRPRRRPLGAARALGRARVARRRAPHRSTAHRPGDRRDRRRRALAGTDELQMQSWHVMFLARGKVGPFRVDSEAARGPGGRVGVRMVLHDEGDQDPRGDLGDRAVRGGR